MTIQCPEVGQIISAYLDGEATQSEWQEAKVHMGHCYYCTQTFVDFLKIKVLCQALAKELFEPSWNLRYRIAACIAKGDSAN